MKRAGVLLLVAVVVAVGWYVLSAVNASAPQPHASAPVTDADGALYLCEQWTRHNAKLGVGDITDRYRVRNQAPKQGGEVVGIDWRAQGSGLLMQSVCEVKHVGTQFVMVSSEAAPK